MCFWRDKVTSRRAGDDPISVAKLTFFEMLGKFRNHREFFSGFHYNSSNFQTRVKRHAEAVKKFDDAVRLRSTRG